ncbi:MAG: ABC transporter ATP-binding protein [Acetobacterales bacterium]
MDAADFTFRNASPPPSVELRDARLTYGDTPLFDGLSFRLPAGEWTCLLGPSGVGKSTLLRLIAGLVRTDEGTGAEIAASDGHPLSGRIAYMAQQDLLMPWLGALDNILIGYRLRRERVTSEVRQRARSLLARVGLKGRENDRPGTLSGGMRQRVALARTLMEDRAVLLMDEPFSALDSITRLRLQELAVELLAGRTVMLVTHDPLEALRLGDSVHVMAGRPVIVDDPIRPAGNPPRPVSDPQLLTLQGDLLARLARAHDRGEDTA